MRLGQPKEEKRAWPPYLLSVVREVSSGYALNPLAKGMRTECLREVTPGGIFVSHNTICHRGTYHHGFGLALTPALPDPYLFSPFFMGGRFDHNLGVAMSFMKHVGLTPQDRRERGMSWHDSHQWRMGTEDIVRRCTQTAEQHLLPFYLDRVMASAESLRESLMTVSDGLRLPEDELRQRAGTVAPPSLDVSLYELTDPQHPWQRLPAPDRGYGLLLAKHALFLRVREMLPEMVQRLERTCRALAVRTKDA